MLIWLYRHSHRHRRRRHHTHIDHSSFTIHYFHHSPSSFVHACIVHSFMHAFIYSFIHSFMHACMHACIHSLSLSSAFTVVVIIIIIIIIIKKAHGDLGVSATYLVTDTCRCQAYASLLLACSSSRHTRATPATFYVWEPKSARILA